MGGGEVSRCDNCGAPLESVRCGYCKAVNAKVTSDRTFTLTCDPTGYFHALAASLLEGPARDPDRCRR